mgnify:CR=1 FL=1
MNGLDFVPSPPVITTFCFNYIEERAYTSVVISLLPAAFELINQTLEELKDVIKAT